MVAALTLASLGSAQFGTIQHEQKIGSNTGGFTGPIGNDARFGVSVAELGDFDGDGIRDLAVGSHRANIGGPERGAVWLLFLNANGTVREHRQISSLVGGLMGLDDHDRFGISACSLGDLDLDGTIDIAVGAYRDDDGGTDFGAVYILFLNPNGTVKAQQKISALEGGFGAMLRMEDSFGWSVENIGDLDDDGVIDLAVGATRDDGGDPDPARDFGAVYVLFMKEDGTVKSHARISALEPGIGSALRPSDRFGGDVVLLDDADGDGVEDLAVGAFGDDPLKVGKVFVLHMNPDGSVKNYQEISANTGGFTGVLGKGDRFGLSLAADDLDGDGLQDLVVGAPGDDDGGADAGAVWVCLLNAIGRVKAFEKISPDFGGFGGFLHPGDNFGISCTVIGDVDRDGAVDIGVGSYQDDQGGFDRGVAWVLFRAGTGVPVADFASTPTSGETPVTVVFTDRSSGEVSSYLWDFGDGQTSTEANPTHVYTETGAKNVTLTVVGPNGSDSLLRERTVVVQPQLIPEADFSASPVSGSAPLTVSFADRSLGSITSYFWDFGDGASSTLRFPKHVYSQLGLYTVSLTVTGPLGTSNATAVDRIEVLPAPPTPEFSSSPSVGPAPLTVVFTDLSSADTTTWSWSFGDGTTSSEPSPSHVYATLGTYDVSLTVGREGREKTLFRPGLVRVVPALTAAFDFVAPTAVAPVSVAFTDRSQGAITAWHWEFGDGTVASVASPTHLYANGGNYSVRLVVTNADTSAEVTRQVVVPEPRPIARFVSSETSGKYPLAVQFTDRSIGQVTSWEWDFGDGTSSSEPSPKHVYYKPGLSTVRFRVHSAGGVNGLVRKDYVEVIPVLTRQQPEARRQNGALPPRSEKE